MRVFTRLRRKPWALGRGGMRVSSEALSMSKGRRRTGASAGYAVPQVPQGPARGAPHDVVGSEEVSNHESREERLAVDFKRTQNAP